MDKKENRGYRLMIQCGLSEEQFDAALKAANNWLEEMKETNLCWKHKTRGGWVSGLRRNGRGYVIKAQPENLLFRRVSIRRRVFGLVKESEVVKIKSNPTEERVTCNCARCSRNEKFGWKNRVPPKMYKLFEFGSIKGQ